MAHPVRRWLLVLPALCLGAVAVFANDAPVFLAVTAPVADLHRDPSNDSEVVSQAVFGSTTVLIDTAARWLRIRSADGYEGWIATEDVARVVAPYASEGKTAMAASLFASLYREPDLEKHEPILTVPFESKLEITGETETTDGKYFSVRLPDGTTGWMLGADLTFETQPLSIAATIELARRFVGIPYRWGGTSSYGFDCSGFTQMLMRRRGVALPRDSRPQAGWEGFVEIPRAELQPGDLLFFGKVPTRINHTGMYIGDGRFIHATRYGHPAVQIGNLEDAPWTAQYITARRVR